MEVQFTWLSMSNCSLHKLFIYPPPPFFAQSKLASMSNDFKSVLEVRTEVRNSGGVWHLKPR